MIAAAREEDRYVEATDEEMVTLGCKAPSVRNANMNGWRPLQCVAVLPRPERAPGGCARRGSPMPESQAAEAVLAQPALMAGSRSAAVQCGAHNASSNVVEEAGHKVKVRQRIKGGVERGKG